MGDWAWKRYSSSGLRDRGENRTATASAPCFLSMGCLLPHPMLSHSCITFSAPHSRRILWSWLVLWEVEWFPDSPQRGCESQAGILTLHHLNHKEPLLFSMMPIWWELVMPPSACSLGCLQWGGNLSCFTLCLGPFPFLSLSRDS